MKFYMKELNFKNFNIIPSGDDLKRPEGYKFMIECYKKYKKLNEDFRLNGQIIEIKIIYECFKREYKHKPKCESLNLKLEWKEVYKKLYDKKLSSDLKLINFQVLNNAFSLNIKYSNRFKNVCFLCRSSIEDLDHLYINCSVTRELFQMVKPMLLNKNIELIKI